MAFCNKCGRQLIGNEQFCAGCGAPVQNTAQQTNSTQDFVDSVKNLNNTADYTAEYDPMDVEQNKIMAVLAYLGLLVLVPILAAPNSRFAKFHANQGLLLTIASFAFGMVTGIITAIFMWIPVLGAIVIAAVSLLSLVFLAASIIGIVNAVQGRAKELPIIGKFRILK